MGRQDGITDAVDINLETVRDREACCAAVHGSQRVRHNLATEQQLSFHRKVPSELA